MKREAQPLEFIRFCSKHGVKLNRWPIYNAVKKFESHVAAVKKSQLSRPGSQSWADCSRSSTPKTSAFEQKSLTFGPLSGWIRT